MVIPWNGILEAFLGLILLCFIISTTITPVIALLFRLFKKTRFIFAWVVSSFIISAAIMIISVVALSALLFENVLNVKKADEQFEEMNSEEVVEESSTENILSEIFKAGSYRRGGRRGAPNPSINAVTKNYNEEDFKGKLIIYAIYNGKKIGEKEFEIELPSQEWRRQSMEPSEINVNREVWNDVEFEYSIHGEFET